MKCNAAATGSNPHTAKGSRTVKVLAPMGDAPTDFSLFVAWWYVTSGQLPVWGSTRA